MRTVHLFSLFYWFLFPRKNDAENEKKAIKDERFDEKKSTYFDECSCERQTKSSERTWVAIDLPGKRSNGSITKDE